MAIQCSRIASERGTSMATDAAKIRSAGVTGRTVSKRTCSREAAARSPSAKFEDASVGVDDDCNVFA
jgi:hypothetical protein